MCGKMGFVGLFLFCWVSRILIVILFCCLIWILFCLIELLFVKLLLMCFMYSIWIVNCVMLRFCEKKSE